MRNHIHLLIHLREGTISRIVQSLLVSRTQRYHRFPKSGGHVWQGRFKSPVIQDDEHLLVVLRYIEANPLRAKLVKYAGDYPWSSFGCHGNGQADLLLDAVAPYDALGRGLAERRRRWSAFVHQTPDETELAAIRRSNETGLPIAKFNAMIVMCGMETMERAVGPCVMRRNTVLGRCPRLVYFRAFGPAGNMARAFGPARTSTARSCSQRQRCVVIPAQANGLGIHDHPNHANAARHYLPVIVPSSGLLAVA